MRLLVLLLILLTLDVAGQHPLAFSTAADIAYVKKNISQNALLNKSFSDVRGSVDKYLGKEVDVPFPKDPAGGYTHDRHKENYSLLFNAGLLYQLTGDKRYASLAKNIFLKYAALNPTLGKHPQATSSSPGRIFWQALNDANWLVYAGLGYDLLYNSFTPEERKIIEEGAFRPEVEYFTRDLKDWFNLIHNHGVWACAGVGIVGVATNNKDYVDMALYGTDKSGKGGFLSQLNQLFSPDGYYTEGPYYVRYALLPFYIFANTINNARPELKIFEHRSQILRKALEAGLQQTNLDGSFLPLNDAIKEKDFTTNEMVTAVNIAYAVYGANTALLPIAKKQNRVSLNRGGVLVSRDLKGVKPGAFYPYKSVEYGDGSTGKEGGISILRTGKDAALTTLVFKYASHGLSHGHYDRLGYLLIDEGKEILQDYGSARFVNIEQKYGGRYLPENKSYAAQTIAHNTLVVDQKSHFNGKEEEAEKWFPEKLFSSVGNEAVQAVSARETKAYPGVNLIRSLFLIQIPESSKPLLVDLFRVESEKEHVYDLPFQYSGQVISTSFKYNAFTRSQTTLGSSNGYQFLWKEAEAHLKDTVMQLTFLTGKNYYTISTMVEDSATIYLTRTGANDPNFNLRREPSLVLRKKGSNSIFLSAVEIHGGYDPITEMSRNANSSVKEMKIVSSSLEYTIVSLHYQGESLKIALSNTNPDKKKEHTVKTESGTFIWDGPYAVWYKNSKL